MNNDSTFQPLLPPSLRTTDDLERDHVLRQRISLFGWLREEHLDIPLGGKDSQGGKEVKGFLEFAQQGTACGHLRCLVPSLLMHSLTRAFEDESL